MTNINWGLLQGTDIGGAFNQGMQQGQQRRREQATDDALRALIANPNDPNVVNNLAQFDPRAALGIQQQQAQQQQAQAEAAARQGAVRGDQGALEQLAGFDIDDYIKLDDRSKKQYQQGIDTIGQLALMADTPQEWDDIVGQLAQSDPSFQKYIGRFDLRDSVIAQTGQAKEFIAQQEPRYQVIPEGGTLVNTRDPAALAQVGAGQVAATEDEAAAIIEQGQRDKIISPEDFARIEAALGPQGQGAARQWLRKQGIEVGKVIGGKRYVQRGGDWYEVN